MKKRILQMISAITSYGLCVMMSCAVFVSCKSDEAGVVGENYTITLDKDDERIAERQTLAVTPSFNNPEAVKLDYKWLSMNLSVATVVGDALGATVTGVKAGATEIKMVCADNPKLWAIFTVEVFARTIELDKGLTDAESIFKGKTLLLTPTFRGEGAADLAYTWTSSDDGIASVEKGANNVATVTGNTPGRVTITITCDTDPELKASCDVEVVPYTISLNPNGGAIRRNGGTLIITPSYNNSGAEGFTYTWASNNTSIATVVKNGNGTATVTGVADGTAKITVTCDTDPTLTASCDVTVETWSVSLDKTNENLEELSDLILTPSFNPTAASQLNYTWTSSDTDVATVTKNANGTATVRGIVAGTATITVKADIDGSITASCIVNVTPLTGLPFNFDKVFIDGTAVGTKTEVKVTLENPDVFAWYGELEAGTLTIPTELSGSDFYYVAPEDGTAEFASTTEDAVEAAAMSVGASTWTIPATGKYRIVINKAAKTLAVYSPEIDLQPVVVEWVLNSVNQVTTVNTLYIYQPWAWDANRYMTQSLADPLVFVYNGAAVAQQTKFGVATENVCYVYSSGLNGSTVNVTHGQTYNLAEGYGGSGDNNPRNSYFSLPSGTTFIILNIRNMTMITYAAKP